VSQSARKGMLFKGGAHIENIARTKVVALDKTGTLTAGRPVVTDYIPFYGYSETEMLQIAASIESMSEHPLAKAVVSKAQELSLSIERPAELRALIGKGVQAEYQNDTWKIGKPSFMDVSLVSPEIADKINKLEDEGKTVIAIQ